MRRVDSPLAPGLVPLSQLSSDEIKKAKQSTFTVLDPYVNKKLLQKSPRMAKQSVREPVSSQAAAEQPPAPL